MDNDSEDRKDLFMGLMWWMKLCVAVLAVPSLAIVISYLVPVPGVPQLAVFVLACWISTFLGMKLMSGKKD